MPDHRFLMACFARSGDDNFARALYNNGLLEYYALGTRRGASGVPPTHTKLQPIFGLLNYAAAATLPTYRAEAFRFQLFRFFGLWTRSLLKPGQPLFTAYAFANEAMRYAKRQNATVVIDAWTSHPAEFWDLLTEEQRRWNSSYAPVSRYYQKRALETVALADYVCTPSTFVRNSFLRQGFPAERLLFCPYPLDLRVFGPRVSERPKEQPLTLLNTGGLSLRKGSPYLLEAFRIIRKAEPDAVLRLSGSIRDEMKPILARYKDLPIQWDGFLDLNGHVQRYQSSDMLLFPSLEDGFAFVVAEALACGVPVITTPNTGASDLVQPGVNGDVVPIREPAALAEATLKWWRQIKTGARMGAQEQLRDQLSFSTFERTFIAHLKRIGLVTGADSA